MSSFAAYVVRLDQLAAPTDITTLNADTTKHGLCPKGDNNAAHVLNGQLAWVASGGGGLINCVAYANFSASGGSIVTRATGNVSSVTRVSAGVYTLNFTSALASTNYGFHAQISQVAGSTNGRCHAHVSVPPTTTTFSIECEEGGIAEPAWVSVLIFL